MENDDTYSSFNFDEYEFMRNEILTTEIISALDCAMGDMFDAYKDGKISREDALSAVAHLLAAIDSDEKAEITSFCDGIFLNKN